VSGDEYRYTYFVTVEHEALIGYCTNAIRLDESRKPVGFDGNYYVLPPGRSEWGVGEYRTISGKMDLDSITKEQYLWNRMELISFG
jgi:hypothetical protein